MAQINFKINGKVEIISENGEIYSSDIQDIDKKSIAISVPIKECKYLPLRKGERIEVIYYEGNSIYKFPSAVIKRTNSNVPLIWINKIVDARKIQRRKFVRIPILCDTKFAPINREVKLDKTNLKDIKFLEGTILDLSGGGVRLKTDSNLKKEDVLAMILKIGDAVLVAKGEVKRIDIVNFKEKIYGVKFLGLSINQQDKIIEYVFEIMRKQMRKGLKEE